MATRKFEPLNELLNDLRVAAEHRRAQLAELDRTIRLADVRCISFDELLSRIERLWHDDGASEIVYRASTEELSHNRLGALAQSVKRLADAADRLPSPFKATIDRAVKRILSRMPGEIATPIALPWLEHRRKYRREIAYYILRKVGLDSESGTALLSVFQRTGDQDCLKLLARNPSTLASSDAEHVVNFLDEEYWRMRVVESLLIAGDERAVLLGVRYPREFAWAVGRQKDATLLAVMRNLLDERAHDLTFVSLYAWALGQIGARDELRRIRNLYIAVETCTALPQGEPTNLGPT